MVECVFCTAPVGKEGEACSLDCYQSWHAWMLTLINGQNDDLCKLQPDDPVPLPLISQPWYRNVTGMEDYL